MRSSRRVSKATLLALSAWLAVAAWLAQPAVAAIIPARPQCWTAGQEGSHHLLESYDDILRECMAELASVLLILPECDNTSADYDPPAQQAPTSSGSSSADWPNRLLAQSVSPGSSGAASSPNNGYGGSTGGTAPAALTGAPGWCESSVCAWLCPERGLVLRSNGLRPPTPPPRG